MQILMEALIVGLVVLALAAAAAEPAGPGRPVAAVALVRLSRTSTQSELLEADVMAPGAAPDPAMTGHPRSPLAQVIKPPR